MFTKKYIDVIFAVQIRLTRRSKTQSLFSIFARFCTLKLYSLFSYVVETNIFTLQVTSDGIGKKLCIFLYYSGIYFVNNCVMAVTISMYIVI